MSTCVLTSSTPGVGQHSAESSARWSVERANQWYKGRPWIIGCNYIPATACNQLEMWQPETFDAGRIDLELGWAETLGLNAVRVFLHDLLWYHDSATFAARIDQFLCTASKHGIDTLFVLFDSCWDPSPQLGKQAAPVAGVHNSRWVQSPGRNGLCDKEVHPRLQKYVTELLSSFRDDPRILGWDLWNEPDNENVGSYPDVELTNKLAFVNDLLPQVFHWARQAAPTQPLTSGAWFGDWSGIQGLTPIQRTQLECSDVISFHNYEGAAEFAKRVGWLQQYHRPILCTEYMARSLGSTFQNILPLAKSTNVAAFSWGFVAGKTQTHLPWTSWQSSSIQDPAAEWFHEILREDGSPYNQAEVDTIRVLAGVELSSDLQPTMK